MMKLPKWREEERNCKLYQKIYQLDKNILKIRVAMEQIKANVASEIQVQMNYES